MLQELWTPEGEILKNNPDLQPWNVYPRPQMKRDSYLNLNGTWDFTAAKTEFFIHVGNCTVCTNVSALAATVTHRFVGRCDTSVGLKLVFYKQADNLCCTSRCH